MGLAACPRASFAAGESGGSGRLFCGLAPQMCLERCGWGGSACVGLCRPSALSARTYTKGDGGGGDDEPVGMTINPSTSSG